MSSFLHCPIRESECSTHPSGTCICRDPIIRCTSFLC
uniref:Uncharacterized protein n=1 Tax=Anguilla anguilla TaxID=7936 RepID=A0A0E9S6N6_ANGAN